MNFGKKWILGKKWFLEKKKRILGNKTIFREKMNFRGLVLKRVEKLEMNVEFLIIFARDIENNFACPLYYVYLRRFVTTSIGLLFSAWITSSASVSGAMLEYGPYLIVESTT